MAPVKTRFTEKDKKELIKLLGMVAAEGGYWPDEATMRAADAVTSRWAPELVILHDDEILLAVYESGVEEFRGMWHIPGGYNRLPEKNIQATCSRVGLSEIGVDVRYIRTLDSYKWEPGEHPYGRPLSLFVECEERTPIRQNGKLRFFPLADRPRNIVMPHARFISKFFLY